MRILIVDDSRFTRALLRREFDGAFEVHEAGNGREAIDSLLKHEPGIVLVDLLMPIMNGYEFVKEARRLGYKGPLVVCTANTQPSVEAMVLEIGATDFVTKPEVLVPGKARAVVEEVLRRAGSGPKPPALPPRHLEELITGALQACADSIASLSQSEVRSADTRQGCPEDLGLPAVPGMDAFAIRVVLGDSVCGVTRLLFPGGAAVSPDPSSVRIVSRREAEGQLGFRLVQEVVQRLGSCSGRKLSVSGIRCAGEVLEGTGGAPFQDGLRLMAHMTLSGVSGDGCIEILGGRAAWARLLELVPPGGARR